jgi:hypothetical protein
MARDRSMPLRMSGSPNPLSWMNSDRSLTLALVRAKTRRMHSPAERRHV